MKELQFFQNVKNLWLIMRRNSSKSLEFHRFYWVTSSFHRKGYFLMNNSNSLMKPANLRGRNARPCPQTDNYVANFKSEYSLLNFSNVAHTTGKIRRVKNQRTGHSPTPFFYISRLITDGSRSGVRILSSFRRCTEWPEPYIIDSIANIFPVASIMQHVGLPGPWGLVLALCSS